MSWSDLEIEIHHEAQGHKVDVKVKLAVILLAGLAALLLVAARLLNGI